MVAIGDTRAKAMIDFATQFPITTLMPRYYHHSSWTGHIPFGFLIVELVKPATLVELGTHNGVSYMTFCQAVAELGIHTRCYAVDTWKGDSHTGGYGEEVLRSLRMHHDPLYGRFSTLLEMSFDEALGQFTSGSIDLLHIDGCHTYDAVRHDFETWRPLLSDRAVVLFHDTTERNDDHQFGVWQLWDELCREYRHFNFHHEHGLGVLGVGADYPRALDVFFDATPPDQAAYRGQFCELAFPLKNAEIGLREVLARAPLEVEATRLKATVAELTARVRDLEQLADGSSQHVALLQQQVADLEAFGAGMQHANDTLIKELQTLRQPPGETSERT